MARIVRIFISERHRRLIVGVVWLAAFCLSLGLIGLYAGDRVVAAMEARSDRVMAGFLETRANVETAFAAIRADVTAEPCTPAFFRQLRRVAYFPDGINEFLYMAGNAVTCTASGLTFSPPVDLGRSNGDAEGGKVAIWMNRDLTFLDLAGLTGTIVRIGDFAAIVEPFATSTSDYPLLDFEILLRSKDGKPWFRDGDTGTYEAYLAATAAGMPFNYADGYIHHQICDPRMTYCVTSRIAVVPVLMQERIRVFFALLGSTLIASWVAFLANALVRRYWSFEARFLRHLDQESLVLAYQPLTDLATGAVTGCEVLARWRDIDGEIVQPCRFIDIVERRGLTERFTGLVAARAFSELDAAVPPGHRLEVNFNIFPRDLDAALLCRLFAPFEAARHRFDLVMEIVESETVRLDAAHREIEALKAAGIKVYIDDFGSGYSNLANIAELAVDGVKLDRTFAMAPAGSVMAQMLGHAIEMIRTTGRTMVVEGVETGERLSMLRAIAAKGDRAQGYHIARPLDAEAFASFLIRNAAEVATAAAHAAKPTPISSARRRRRA
ncbi:MAG: EAL domain-containing protein [Rhizobiaceae bacterium]|nr:MAG: EAL domain-containing protein [Rhizobiaceae bacterium]CAG1015988.1 putative cyclic di-GMP phosphodiesterase PdeC [Rhizobiaceae bacterium]